MILSIVREHCFYPGRPSNQFSSASDKTKVKVVFCFCNTNKSIYLQKLSNRSMKLLRMDFKHFFLMSAYLENSFVIFGVK